MNNSKGFTLVELAIVLVIIGVILGGVVKGTELVKSAKIKGLYKNFQSVQTAYYGFQDTVGGLPGDANNNGIIAGAWNAAGNQESRQFWSALREANLFPGGATDLEQPDNSYGTIMGVTMNGVAGFTANTDLVLCFDNIPVADIAVLDQKYDEATQTDGTDQTGDIRTTTDVNYTSPTGTADMCIKLN